MNTKKLKQLVLDLAIHGKLVPQDPNDEPASELLKRIQADVETHGRASNKSKGKKTAVSSVDLDEVPFEEPEGWCWCRLSDICDVINGTTVDKALEKKNGQIAYLRVGDMNLPENKTEIVISKTYLDAPKNVVPINSFIFPKRGGAILTNKKRIVKRFPIWIDLNLMAVNVLDSEIFDYIFLHFSTIDLGTICNGGNIPQINNNDIAPLLIPLPPLSEQKRIVSAIEKWFAVIDQLEKNEADLKKSIDQTKKKVLDLAIRGKLVAQNPEDEPAGELLARIRADVETHGRASNKAKGKKSSIPSVDLDEVPFEVPEGWEWCRMNDVCDIINGSTVEKTLEKENGQFAYLRVGDMNLPENKTEIVTSKTYLDNPLNLVPINSFIFPKRGGAILTNKKRSVRKFPIWIDLNLMAVNVIAADLFDYLFMFFSTIDLGKVCNGGNIPQINFSDIAKILVPLPPLAEQKRIVEKVEEVMGVLERIEGCVARS